MPLHELFVWMTEQKLFQDISGGWAFPFFESLHVVGMALLLGSIGILDLRLLGLAANSRSVTQLSRETLPWTWTGFGLVLITGFLTFGGAADSYADNRAFQMKMLLLVLAAANMLVFHLFAWKSVESWDTGKTTLGARIAGGLSLLLWCGVVAMGRLIAFA